MQSINDVKVGKKNERIVVYPTEMCKVLERTISSRIMWQN